MRGRGGGRRDGWMDSGSVALAGVRSQHKGVHSIREGGQWSRHTLTKKMRRRRRRRKKNAHANGTPCKMGKNTEATKGK